MNATLAGNHRIRLGSMLSATVLLVTTMLPRGVATKSILELNRTRAVLRHPARGATVAHHRMLAGSGKCFYDPRQRATKCKHADGSVWTSAGATKPLLDAPPTATSSTTTTTRSPEATPVDDYSLQKSELAASSALAAPAALDQTTAEEKRSSSPAHHHHKKHHAFTAAFPDMVLDSNRFDHINHGNITWTLPPLQPPSASCPSVMDCGGVNFRAVIAEDLKPWSSSSQQQHSGGGLSRANVDGAMAWKVLQNPHTKLNAKGWLRVTVWQGQLFASHVGTGQGSRDGVFLLALLELLQRANNNKLHGNGEGLPRVPDVDFVLYTEDRARLSAASFPSTHPHLPFALSFARHDDYLDVAVPDPSFWGWAEMGVAPHWFLTQSSATTVPWAQRANKVHWRGGMRRSGRLREALVECASSKGGGASKAQTSTSSANANIHSWMDIKPRTESNWEHPMDLGPKGKLALFIQGEGYTSSKQRVLASGSCPVFAELTGHDTYYGRFLKENVHFKRVRVDPPPEGAKLCVNAQHNACAKCGDLTSAVHWASTNDEAAQQCGQHARDFASALFARRSLLLYLGEVLTQVANLQAKSSYDYAAVVKEVHSSRSPSSSSSSSSGGGEAIPITAASILSRMDAACGHKAERGNCAEPTALVQWWLTQPDPKPQGADVPCRRDLCPRCCPSS